MGKPKASRKRKSHAHAVVEERHLNGAGRRDKSIEDMNLDDLLNIDVFGNDDAQAGGDPSDSEPGSGSPSDEEEGDLEMSREDMEKLKETDPEFYRYLRDTDEGLLDFDVNAESDGEEEGTDEQQEVEQAEIGPEPKDDERQVITSESLKSWCKVAQKTASLGAVRQVTRLYRIACHYGDADDDETLQMASSAVYNNILLFMLGKADGIFRKALSIKIGDDAVDVREQDRWSKYEPLVKSFLGNSLHLLGKVTDAEMQAYILRRLRDSVIFLKDFDKIRRKLIAQALTIFSSAEDEPKVQAILFVRALAMKIPSQCLDSCLKGVYKSFVGASKFFSAASAPNIRFMASCAVEMYGIDMQATYQHAFTSIKDLAIQMRQALTSKSKESYKEVYCWQTINSLELWVTVLVTYPSDLEPLFYPVSQLLLGACTLIGSPSFIPLRLKCIRMLNELSSCRKLYTPMSPLLVEILQWKDLFRKPKPVPANSIPDLSLRLRVGSTILRASSFQEDVVDTVLELLCDHLAQWGYHPGFLEIAYIPLLRLRAFVKSNNRDRFKRGAKQLCQAIVETQECISRARNTAQFSPKDSVAIQKFVADMESQGATPIVRLSNSLREQAIQRMKMRSLEEAVIEEESDEEPQKKLRRVPAQSEELDVNEEVPLQENDQSHDEEDESDFEDKIAVYQLSDDDD